MAQAARPARLWLIALLALCAAAPPPWRDPHLPPDARAGAALAALTQTEKLTLVLGYFGKDVPDRHYTRPAASRPASAGYIPGIPRLDIPPLWETDAGIGVATQAQAGPVRERTALPAGIATAATFDPALAARGGAMIGAEARASGFNVMLAGGVNLARDPRNGRNFEYAGEDPLLAAAIVGAEVAGIQSNHVIATVKHYALNDQEFGRTVLSADIDPAAARESDLLAFEGAIERGHPGAVMCAYNRINTVYACENPDLLSRTLKQDWHYPGFVMSDWGAVHSTIAAANAGLDQESAADAFDSQDFFGPALRDAITAGKIRQARLDDMARRILRAMYATGVADDPLPAATTIDTEADAAISQQDAEQGIVLLRNQNAILPLRPTLRSLAVIGGHADRGVLSGGGSAQVYPVGGNAVPGLGPATFPGPIVYDPSPPLAELRRLLPRTDIRFDDGADPARAASLAARSDAAIVFATAWSAESQDNPLDLPDGQNALIAAIARANPRSVVVLETGGPVLMPWRDQAQAVIEAWYPGSRGGRAIARVLCGRVDAAGRLPISFPAAAAQLPRPAEPGNQAAPQAPFTITYNEGAAVGYKWYAKTGQTPLYPFGFGLSYGTVAYSGLSARSDGVRVTASFAVRNLSARPVAAVPQIYAVSPRFAGGVPLRLAAFAKLALPPHAARHVTLTIDPRVLANWREPDHVWVIPPGAVTLTLSTDAEHALQKTSLDLPAATLPP